jgi:hypothetical protein
MGDREQLAQLLAEVAASQPALTTLSSAAARESNVRGTPTADPAVIARQQVIRWLAANTTAAGRFAAADAAATVGDVRLAEVLRMN